MIYIHITGLRQSCPFNVPLKKCSSKLPIITPKVFLAAHYIALVNGCHKNYININFSNFN